jgi:hypothetical protein
MEYVLIVLIKIISGGKMKKKKLGYGNKELMKDVVTLQVIGSILK